MTAAALLATYEDLATVTEALCARLRGGDVDGAAGFAQEREALVTHLSQAPAPSEVVATIERILAIDREVLALLEALTQQTRLALTGYANGRQSLRSYRGGAGASSAFVDQLG